MKSVAAKIKLIWLAFALLALPLVYFALSINLERLNQAVVMERELRSIDTRIGLYKIAYELAELRRISAGNPGGTLSKAESDRLQALFESAQAETHRFNDYPVTRIKWESWLRDKLVSVGGQDFSKQIETAEHLLSIVELFTKEAHVGALLPGREYRYVDFSQRIARLQEHVAQLRGLSVLKAANPDFDREIDTLLNSLSWSVTQKQIFLTQELPLLVRSDDIQVVWRGIDLQLSAMLQMPADASPASLAAANESVDALLEFREKLDGQLKALVLEHMTALQHEQLLQLLGALVALLGTIALAAYVSYNIKAAAKAAMLLGEKEYMYRVAVDSALVGIFDRPDVSRPEMFWSEEMRRLLYYDDDIEPVPLVSLVHASERSKIVKLRDTLFVEPGTTQIQARLLCGDGEYRWFGVNVVTSYDKNTGKMRLSGTLFNLDEVKEVEALRTKEAELEQSLQELSRVNSDLNQFAHIASHDLQEPLRMVTNFMELLAEEYDEVLDSDAKQYIHFAHDGATRMQALLDDLLAYARHDQSQIELEMVDLNSVLETVISDLSGTIRKTDANIRCGDLPMLMADEVGLQRVLQNLLSNAIKYQPAGQQPLIDISVMDDGENWHLMVSDNGIGIDPDKCEMVFQPFKRLHGKEAYPGNGVGLAIVKKIVNSWGGSISVASHGVGSVFTIVVPQSEHRLVRGAA